MGEEHRRRKDFVKAEETYRRAISLNNRYVDAYLRLALLQGGGNRWEDAARTLEACIGVVPAYAPAWMDLGRTYLSLGRSGDALAAFRNALVNSTDPALRKQASEYVNTLGQGTR
jgi:tetratricopeptide (TPR) repeat protein